MNRTVLQVPISPTLRKDAEKQALYQGFSSLQDAVRMFLNKLATKKIGVSFNKSNDIVYLSPKAERRYTKMVEDIRSGKVKTKSFTDVDSLMEDLNS